MKKLLFLVSMFVMLAAITAPAAIVRAAVNPPMGTCTITTYPVDGEGETKTSHTTKDACKATTGYKEGNWVADTTSAPPATGACRWHVSGGHPTEGEIDNSNPPLTKEQCGFNAPQAYWDPSAVPAPGEAPKATCKILGSPDTITTEQDCRNKGGTWGNADGGDDNGEDSPPPNQTILNQPYHLLAPLPCPNGATQCTPDAHGNLMLETFDPTQTNVLCAYLNLIIKIFIGICAVLGVIMITIGGIEYMTSGLITNKEHAIQKISGSIYGLILALAAWTLLYTINPAILEACLPGLTSVTITADLGGESSTPFAPMNKTSLQSLGITCNGSGGSSQLSAIGQSFIGHATYSQSSRNTTSGTTAFVDCSSFVDQVYNCAGLPVPGSTTSDIFSSGTPVTGVSADGTSVNGTALKVGDLLGWKQGEGSEKNGHVMMYIGNGQVVDIQGDGKGVSTRSLNSAQFQGRIKYVKRLQ